MFEAKDANFIVMLLSLVQLETPQPLLGEAMGISGNTTLK